MSTISTHVLDTARGKPAAGVPIVLSIVDGAEPRELGRGDTDPDGRVRTLLPAGQMLAPGTYVMWFDTATYFKSMGIEGFYPEVSVCFVIRDGKSHYHVPLLLSPYGFSTYRGS